MSESPPVSRRHFCAQEKIIERFEQAWQHGSTPELGIFLSEVNATDQHNLLTELVAIDLEYRWQAGEAVPIETYFARFPALLNNLGIRRQLIEHECQVRRRYGLEPLPRELHERFAEDYPEVDVGAGEPTSALGHAALVCGVRLGRYRLEEQIGRGGFGTVWRAWDGVLGRFVALKVPHWDIASNSGTAQRVWREIQLAARVNHELIVPIHEVGQWEGRMFIVFQLIEGDSLANLVHGQQLSWRQAVRWVAKLSEAVAVAHQAGIVHRDIKPANILIDSACRPVLADFGLACLADQPDRLTREGDVVGTPAYMAPELVLGQAYRADARCDVYSLGAVLYELVAGRAPFVGNPGMVLRQVENQEPPSLRTIAPHLPRDLGIICSKAMAKEPHRRYQSADDLAADLWRLLDHRPITAKRIGPWIRLNLWRRRHPGVAATIAAAVVVCVVVAMIGFAEVVRERNRFEAQRDQALGHLYASLVNEAQATIRARDTGWAQHALIAIEKARALPTVHVDPFELRNTALECLISPHPSVYLKSEWRSAHNRITVIAVSPDGRWVASAGRNSALVVQDLEVPQHSFCLNGHRAEVLCLAFSADGKWLASGARDEMVLLWDVGDWKSGNAPTAERQLALSSNAVCDLAWSVDGASLLVACGNGGIYRVDTPQTADQQPKLIATHRDAARCIAVLPDGRRVASGGDDRTILLTDMVTGNKLNSWHLDDGVRSLSASPDGRLLVAVEPSSYGFCRIALETGNIEGRPTLHRAAVNQVIALGTQPGGGLLSGATLTGSSDGSVRLWNLEVEPIADINGPYAGVQSMAWLAETNELVVGYADGMMRRWQLWQSPAVSGTRYGADVVALSDNRFFDGSYVWLVESDRNIQRNPLAPNPAHRMALDDAHHLLAMAHDLSRDADGPPNGAIQVWNTLTRASVASWIAHPQTIIGLGWLAGEQCWVSAGREGTIALWNERGELRHRFDSGIEAPGHMLVDRTGNQIVLVGATGARIWNADDLQGGSATDVAWSYRQVLAAAVGNKSWIMSSLKFGVEVRDGNDGRLLHELSGNRSPVVALAVSADGSRLVGAARDMSLHFWDLSSGALMFSVDQGGSALARQLAWHPRHHWISVCHGNQPTVWWDVESRLPVARLFPLGDYCMTFSPQGERLYLGSAAGGVRVCEVEPLLRQVEDVGTGKATTTGVRFDLFDYIAPAGHFGLVWGAASSPDGTLWATAGHDGWIKLWVANSRQLLQTFETGADVAWCVRFSPDGNWLAAGLSLPTDEFGFSRGQVNVWNRQRNQPPHILEAHDRLVVSIAFHPWLPLMATSGMDGQVWLWTLDEAIKGVVIGCFDEYFPKLEFHPSGDWLVGVNRDHRVAIWETSHMQSLLDGIAEDGVHASSSRVSFASLPSALTNDIPRWLDQHTESVWAVAFSKDGSWMATGTDSGTVILWQCPDWQPIAVLRGVASRIRSLAFSPDDCRLAVGTYPPNGVTIHLDVLREQLRSINLDWANTHP